jgi:hypothetical protein
LLIYLYLPALTATFQPPTARIPPPPVVSICGSTTLLKFLNLAFSNSDL